MFNIIIRRAVVATAGASIALTLMTAPASAAPKADGGERQRATNENQTDEQQSSTASMTITISCDNVVSVTSDKDISHVEWTFANGEGDKDEDDVSGDTWEQEFSETIVWAKAKSGTSTVEATRPAECDEAPAQTATPDDDGVKNDDVDVEGDDVVNALAAPSAGTSSGAPQNAAPEAFKCGEVMAADVNGDGTINSADCTQVLGEVFERPAALAADAVPAVAGEAVAADAVAELPAAEVLGVQFENAPAALARTGATFAPLLLGAIVLILSGVLMVHGRRRPTNA